MKKFVNILFCAFAAMAAISCNKEIEETQEPKADRHPMTITATTTQTRTALDEDYVSIKWLSTDVISVFDGTSNNPFESTGEGQTVEFNGDAGTASVYYALYPYDENAALSGTSVTTTLPAEQTPKVGTFADGLNINAAKSENTTFVFDNVLSVAKFTIDATQLGGKTIRSVTFTSTYPLAGDVVINYGETITATAGTNTVKEVTLENEKDGLADGTYYFVVLPNAGGEITMTFLSTDGYSASKTATLSKAFTAGSIKNLGTVKGLTWIAEPKEYKIVFIDKTNGSPTAISSSVNASTVIESSSLTYVTSQPFSSAENAYYGGNSDGLPLRLGKSSAAGSLTIALSDAGKVSATSIIINAKQYTSGKTMKIGVNGSAKQQPGNDYVDLSFDGGNIEKITLETDGYIYVKYIKIVYIEKQSVSLSFGDQTAFEIIQGDSFTPPTLTTDPTGLVVTYTSSNETVATVNASSGDITLAGGIGSTTITASFAGDDTYNSGSASYVLTVNRTAATSIAQIKSDLANGSNEFSATLTNAIVTRKFSDYIAYIQDGTAGILVTDAEYLTQGDSYTGTVTGEMETYQSQPRITSIDVSKATKTSGATIPAPEEVTIAMLVNDMSSYDGKLCKIVKAKANATLATGTNKSVTISQGENSMTLFTRVSFDANAVVGNQYYDIIGFPTMYNSTKEIVVLSTNDVTEATLNWVLSSIAVKTAPNKTSYVVGEYFDPTGLVLSTVEMDSEDNSITRAGNEVAYLVETMSSFSFDPSLNTQLAESHRSVVITYNEKTTAQAITVIDPDNTKDYYKLVTSVDDIVAGSYVIGALRSTSATNKFYFAKASVSSGDWEVEDEGLTVEAVNGVRRFEIGYLPSGAKEFTLTGNNTSGFTIKFDSQYLYYTKYENRKLSFGADKTTYLCKFSAKSGALVAGGVIISMNNTGDNNGAYTISENSTATGAIRGYTSTTQYRAIYLFKKVNE